MLKRMYRTAPVAVADLSKIYIIRRIYVITRIFVDYKLDSDFKKAILLLLYSIMQRFLELCNLSHAADSPDETFALHAGGGGRENPIVYQSPSWGGSLFERISLLWRYGPFALLKLDNFIGNLLDNFGQIYPRLAAGMEE